MVYSVHEDSAKYTAVAIAQSSNGSFLNYNDYCSGYSDKRRCEEFRVLRQLARTKLEARSIWRHLAYSASPQPHSNLILSQSFEPERNQFSVEVSAQYTLFWAFLFVSLILSLHLIISKTSNRLSSTSFRVMGYLSSV